MKIRFICATRKTEQDFYTQTALGQSLTLFFPHYSDRFELRLFAENTKGLPSIYNQAIEEVVASEPRVMVFIHDDVHLVDLFWPDKICHSLEQFEIIGLAGNKVRSPNQPSWGFVFQEDGLGWDVRENLSGAISHGSGFPPKTIDIFGAARQEVKLLDGLMLIMHSDMLLQHKLRFDEQFQFHFYDLDFCRQAEVKGIKMGTWDISVVHQSGGNFGSDAWRDALLVYLGKWGS